jgi:hypothetical protein
MADIMQEGCHDKVVGGSLPDGKIGSLERVLHLRHGLAMVCRRTAPGKEVQDLVDN